MKKTIAIAIIILLSTKSYSQISKGNWLIGGDVKFNYTANKVVDSRYSSTTLNINPQLGYFILDKFAVGLRPSLGFVFSSGASNHVTSYSVGPYARYYFLDETRMLNLFLQGDYAYGGEKTNDQTARNNVNKYSISGGPVVYFNSSVGLEFVIAYSHYKMVAQPVSVSTVEIGLGLQVSLSK